VFSQHLRERRRKKNTDWGKETVKRGKGVTYQGLSPIPVLLGDTGSVSGVVSTGHGSQHMGSSLAAGGALCVVRTATSSSAAVSRRSIAAAALAALATRFERRSSWSFLQCFLHSSFHWTGSVCRSACDAKGCG
jgi:hypothetical protein